MTTNTAVVTWDQVRYALTEITSVDEFKEARASRDKVEALRRYAKRRGESIDLQNQMAEYTIRLARDMGEFLLEMPKNPGGKGEQELYRSHGATGIETLEDLGITKSESSRCQAIAKLPTEAFEQHVEEIKEKREELTQAGLLKLAQQRKREQKERDREQKRNENRQVIAQAKTIDKVVAEVAIPKFSTIVLDPPWDWGDEGDVDQMGRARPTYGTMSLDDLLALPVGKYAETDCHLYLWITNRSLPKGFRLLEAWGFRYVTCITWVKPSFGMGNYFRGQTEHLLFGVKGSLPLKRHDVGTVLEAPRGPKGHSSKPPEAYDLIESCSPGPYLELFARSERADWTSWGAEV